MTELLDLTPEVRMPELDTGLTRGMTVFAAGENRTVDTIHRMSLTTTDAHHLLPVFRDRDGAMWAGFPFRVVMVTSQVGAIRRNWVSVASLLRQRNVIALCIVPDPMPVSAGVVHCGE